MDTRKRSSHVALSSSESPRLLGVGADRPPHRSDSSHRIEWLSATHVSSSNLGDAAAAENETTTTTQHDNTITDYPPPETGSHVWEVTELKNSIASVLHRPASRTLCSPVDFALPSSSNASNYFVPVSENGASVFPVMVMMMTMNGVGNGYPAASGSAAASGEGEYFPSNKRYRLVPHVWVKTLSGLKIKVECEEGEELVSVARVKECLYAHHGLCDSSYALLLGGRVITHGNDLPLPSGSVIHCVIRFTPCE